MEPWGTLHVITWYSYSSVDCNLRFSINNVINKGITIFFGMIQARSVQGWLPPQIIDDQTNKTSLSTYELQMGIINTIPEVIYNTFVSKYCTTIYKFDRGNSNEVNMIAQQERFQR